MLSKTFLRHVQGWISALFILFASSSYAADEITLNLQDADIRAFIATVSKFTCRRIYHLKTGSQQNYIGTSLTPRWESEL